MTLLKAIAITLAAASLTACAKPESATRVAGTPTTMVGSSGSSSPEGQVILTSHYDVAEIEVRVPRSLTVSEANSFVPEADIVWRGDPLGDRHAQVQAIMQEGLARGTAMMTKGPAVKIIAEVVSFHCLTEKARYTIGGNHNMHFNLTVVDLASGAVLEGPRLVKADVEAAGGKRALAEDAAGRTQKVVVTERLAQVIRKELSIPAHLTPGAQLVSRNTGAILIIGAEN